MSLTRSLHWESWLLLAKVFLENKQWHLAGMPNRQDCKSSLLCEWLEQKLHFLPSVINVPTTLEHSRQTRFLFIKRFRFTLRSTLQVDICVF